MKNTTHLLLIPALFLCLLSPGVHLSNPDSEIVQESSEIKEEGTDNVQKSASMRNADTPERSYGGYSSSGRMRRVKVLDFIPGTGYVWREFEDIYDSVSNLRDPSVLSGFFRGVKDNNGSASAADNSRRRPASSAGGYRPSNNNGPSAAPDDGAVSRDYSTPIYSGSINLTAYVTVSTTQSEKKNDTTSSIASNPGDIQHGQNRKTSISNTDSFSGNFNRGASSSTNRRTSSGAPSQADTPFQPSAIPSNGGRIAPASLDSNLFAGIINDFAFKLTDAINPQSNFVISPLSVFVAVAMCYLASEGRTKDQLEKAMGLDEKGVHEEHLHKGISDLMASLFGNQQQQLLVANGLFLGHNFIPDAKYRVDVQRYYRAQLQNLDFTNPDLSLAEIDRWVSRNTRNAIPTLLDRPPPPQTRMMLLNAIYFKGRWKTQFPTDLTYTGSFTSSDGSIKEVPTMALYGEKFPVYRSDEQRHSFLKLPYSGDQISMIIALPYSLDQSPISSVRGDTLCYVLDAMRTTQLGILSLPKFRLEDVRSLRRPFMRLGAVDLFDRQAVNLQNLRHQNDVYVSTILQKALVEVNEEGTTAAAVTGVRFVPLSIRNTTDFVVDRPFSFYIIHEPSGLVLFHGKVLDLGENEPQGGTERVPARTRPNSEINSDSTSKGRRPGSVAYEYTK